VGCWELGHFESGEKLKKINGITILEKGDNHEDYLPEGLALPIFEGLHAPYGFKSFLKDGKLMWTPGTEQDYREAEAQKLGVDPSAIAHDPCSGLPCNGHCGILNAQFCSAHIKIPGNFWYCSCP
jgi:hypothetical protein